MSNELDDVTRLCERLGAPPAQARVMAMQLLKRTEQLVRERGLTREQALQQLLEVLIKGRNGETPARFSGPAVKEGLPRPGAADETPGGEKPPV